MILRSLRGRERWKRLRAVRLVRAGERNENWERFHSHLSSFHGFDSNTPNRPLIFPGWSRSERKGREVCRSASTLCRPVVLLVFLEQCETASAKSSLFEGCHLGDTGRFRFPRHLAPSLPSSTPSSTPGSRSRG